MEPIAMPVAQLDRGAALQEMIVAVTAGMMEGAGAADRRGAAVAEGSDGVAQDPVTTDNQGEATHIRVVGEEEEARPAAGGEVGVIEKIVRRRDAAIGQRHRRMTMVRRKIRKLPRTVKGIIAAAPDLLLDLHPRTRIERMS